MMKLRIVLEVDGKRVLSDECELNDLWDLPFELGTPGQLGATGQRFMSRVMSVSSNALHEAARSADLPLPGGQ